MLHTAGPEFSLPAPVCKGNHTEVHALEKTGGGRIRKDPKLWEVVLPKYISRNGRKPEIGQLFVELRHGRRRALTVTLPSAGLTHRQTREGGGCAFGSRREPGLFCRPRSGHHGPFTKTRTQPSRGLDVSRSQFSVIEGDLMAPNRKSAGASWKLERSSFPLSLQDVTRGDLDAAVGILCGILCGAVGWAVPLVMFLALG